MQRTQIARTSEALSAFDLAAARPGEDPLDPRIAVLKSAVELVPEARTRTAPVAPGEDVMATRRTRNEPNEPGSDFLAVNRDTGRILYTDDKAWRVRRAGAPGTTAGVPRDRIDRVPALTKSLAANMAADADALDAMLAHQRAHGLPVDPVVAKVPERLRRAAAALDRAFPSGFDLRRDGPALRRLMRRHNIDLGVTNALQRGRSGVSDDLARAGFRFLDGPAP
jgi:hypothetical protein